MTRLRLVGLILVASLVATACGGGGGGGAGPTALNLSGNYRVNLSSTGGFGIVSGNASLAQSGSSVSGSYANNRGGTYRVSGNAAGDTATLTLAGTNNPQTCTASVTLTDSGNQGNGTYLCSSPSDSGQFTLTRV